MLRYVFEYGRNRFHFTHSMKVYVPPYLATGLHQPTFNVSEDDWSYNGQYTITNVHLFQGQMSGLRISLVGGEFHLMCHPTDIRAHSSFSSVFEYTWEPDGCSNYFPGLFL